MCTLATVGIDRIGAPVEFEALSTTDGEGGKGQSECLGRGVHEMEEESEVDRAGCLVLRARCPVSKPVPF